LHRSKVLPVKEYSSFYNLTMRRGMPVTIGQGPAFQIPIIGGMAASDQQFFVAFQSTIGTVGIFRKN
jgi:hypothetical protein